MIRKPQTSPFLQCGPAAEAETLAILHLKRDHLIPTILRAHDELNEGYSEGKVTNTRFGSFPHSTLIGISWGSQIRASAVDTGSRGRKGWEGTGKKRKRQEDHGGAEQNTDKVLKATLEPKVAVEASSGFVHLLPPTPEIWTASLPHRTQVVYTPDYSYILHRIRARPGTTVIEAGAGSGSFTHAAARAVYNGSSTSEVSTSEPQSLEPPRQGKVYSFEFHEQRAQKLQNELREHGLSDTVFLTHRDVCADGFVPDHPIPNQSIRATAIFLDLPAPWLALKHLTRQSSCLSSNTANEKLEQRTPILDPNAAVHICTFSPCIEQAQRTISTLRQHGWLDVEMAEISARRIEVRRERVGLQEEGLRGVNDSPASVDEALTRLREVEAGTRKYREGQAREQTEKGKGEGEGARVGEQAQIISKQQRLENIRNALESRKLYKEGRLVHKAEPELKTHTSYLVFAILPREWSDEDERRAQERWGSVRAEKGMHGQGREGPVGNRQRKREAKARAKAEGVQRAGDGDADTDVVKEENDEPD